ncbi:MAG: hypothetical protein ACXABV_13350 [Candidatus Thorarchaeota archaeon]|jgi:hypothetical protein
MSEKTREERFDEVFQMVLIVVALSFDILWAMGRLPIAEIAVFVFVLTIWAYGNLKGGIWEYPFKLGSFNLAIILLTNFYSSAIFGDTAYLGLWELLISGIVLPLICVGITLSLISYLRESVDRQITMGLLIGGTVGYVLSMTLLTIFV